MNPNFDLDLMCNDLGDLMEDDSDLSMEGLPAPAPKPQKVRAAPAYKKPRERSTRALTRPERYARIRAQGKCVQCGRPSADGKARCAVCNEQRRTYACSDRGRELRRRLAVKWKAEGKCACCGVGRAIPGFVICEKCRTYRNDLRRKKKAEKS